MITGYYFDKNYLVSTQKFKLKNPVSPVFYSKERKEFRWRRGIPGGGCAVDHAVNGPFTPNPFPNRQPPP